MGQKTEKIKELQNELSLTRQLLRHIGDTLGIEFGPPTNLLEVQREHQRFLDVLRRVKDGATILGAKGLALDFGGTVTRRPRPVAPGSWDTHDEEVDEQIDRLEAQGLTQPRDPRGGELEQFESSILSPPRGGGGAMVRRDAGDAYSTLPTNRLTLADLAPTILEIGNELGLNVGEDSHDHALRSILEEIVRVKNQGADVEAEQGSKFLSANKSLGQAIAHDHAQTAELREELARTRTIVNRLAAAMQIGQWDKDGTELLERAQRWETWRYDLMTRIKELRAVRPSTTMSLDESDVAQRISDELQRHLDHLLSTKELAAWLKSLEKTVAAGAVKVDAGPPVPPYPFDFQNQDCSIIERAMNESLSQDPDPPSPSARERILAIIGVFREAMHSAVGRSEFARTMNLIILPILARQRAAQKVPENAARPTE